MANSLFILAPIHISTLLGDSGRGTGRAVIRALDEAGARTAAAASCIPAGAIWLDTAKTSCTAVPEDGTALVLATQPWT